MPLTKNPEQIQQKLNKVQSAQVSDTTEDQ